MEKIRTNDLKKGDWVRLRCGWLAQVKDNRKGDRRCLLVYGFETEMGDVYSHDIVQKIEPTGGGLYRVVAEIEHTKSQVRLREEAAKWGM